MIVAPGTALIGKRQDTKAAAYRSSLITMAVVGPPFLYLLLLFAAPLVLMLVYSFGELDGFDIVMTWTLQQYKRIAGEESVHRLLFKSFRIALETTAITIVVSYPIAFILARIVPRRWQSVLLMMVVLPSWTSFIIRTYSWLLVLGDHGLINSTLTTIGLIGQPLDLSFNEFSVAVAIVYVSIPWMVLPIYVSLEKIDWSLIEAGEALARGQLDGALLAHCPSPILSRCRGRHPHGLCPGDQPVRHPTDPRRQWRLHVRQPRQL